MIRSKKLARLPAENICLTCGLCCNGVIFSDVKLQPGEDLRYLRELGLPLSGYRAESRGRAQQKGWKFPQPCTALEGCLCRIYPSRPKYCRQFECLLLKKVKRRGVSRASALRLIRSAKREAERVRILLTKLGDAQEDLPLADRVHRISEKLERSGPDSQTAELYSRLTLAFHRLSLTLNRTFYPAPSIE